jgi:hypothetical protein
MHEIHRRLCVTLSGLNPAGRLENASVALKTPLTTVPLTVAARGCPLIDPECVPTYVRDWACAPDANNPKAIPMGVASDARNLEVDKTASDLELEDESRFRHPACVAGK